MADRKPLVVVDGQLRQLASGDTLDAKLDEVDFVTVENDEGTDDLVVGTPVYVSSDGGASKAQADSLATALVLGLAVETIAPAASGRVLSDGKLAAATAEWDAITGDTGGLTPGSSYFLDSATAGMLTTSAPTAEGEVVARVGRALSATILEVSVAQTIAL